MVHATTQSVTQRPKEKQKGIITQFKRNDCVLPLNSSTLSNLTN